MFTNSNTTDSNTTTPSVTSSATTPSATTPSAATPSAATPSATSSSATSGKKYNIVDTIEDDAPFGEANYYTISFLTPQRLDNIKYFKIRGIKIHNAYTSAKAAHDDAKKIKDKNKQHDIYVAEIGKIYGWDDATKVDEVEYDNQKLNDLEKTRRENMDKIKLMSEQFNNEYKTLHANVPDNRKINQLKKMQQKLYEKGLITKKEFEMLQEENKPLSEIKDEAAKREKIDQEISEAYKTDYLDENEPTALKYACITIYSPKNIGNLKTLCFKVRGLFQTKEQLAKRIKKLESLYPRDQIQKFEIGKWCGFCETNDMEESVILHQLNYAMKCHIEHLEVEKEDFEKRKDKMVNQNEQEQKLKKLENRSAKRKDARKAKKDNKNQPHTSAQSGTPTQSGIPTPSGTPTPSQSMATSQNPTGETHVPTTSTENKSSSITYIDDPADVNKISNIVNFLDDPELRNRFPAETNKSDKMTIDI